MVRYFDNTETNTRNKGNALDNITYCCRYLSHQPMSVLTSLRNAVRPDRETYVCRFCNLSFDRQLTNCPACGCSEVE